MMTHLRALRLGLAIALISACAAAPAATPDRATAPASTPASTPATETETPAEPSAAAEPAGDHEPIAAAMTAYRNAVAAQSKGDRAGYEAALADPLSCFYDRKQVPRKEVVATRIGGPTATIHALGVLESTPDRVVLVDWGHYTPRGEDEVLVLLHTKAVVMTKTADGWKIAGEGGGKQRCGFDLGAVASPPAVADCRREYEAHVAKAKACRCDDGSTGCNFCQSMLDYSELEECLANVTHS